jgi:uncharacterized YigZ family protein
MKMVEKDEIFTIKAFSESKFKERGSQFIGLAYPIESTEDFNKIHSEVKKKFFDASHHCYAFRLVNSEFRYSDAGEPNGTAGIRILNAIDHYEFTNVLVLVLRYFGGTKLGVGPLGKAYYHSAELTLKSAEIIKKNAFQKISIKADFPFTSLIHKAIADFEMRVVDNEFSDGLKFTCWIKPKLFAKFKNYLEDKSGGTIAIMSDDGIIYL